ncbi:DUF1223 domain-containing protein [Roseovarius nanhaiticus]|uniref:DUF1223 domain-containing protein n=1 Tax=Roseovarius nanhaiticus TaxID=573024 RepID=A0A1N7F8N1_9RHOB|nr:DUF1223 domain-containing protein [Roseovarius nanhaiticus]SEK59355.1 hypothetical protein SAMN05216208_1287 [Roseovarius nanhaiticus]SIR96707.1 hypothetical protein SAMN05421666_0848 [Roseovarius nanhaiticus]
MRSLITKIAAAAILCWPGGAATAADGPVLVELYTSQGCSSCPKADAFFKELSKRDDVVALALHVDYWDYIFDDVFGKAAHTRRQYGYAAAGGRDMVYTPQMVIGGQDHAVGNRPKDVSALINKHLGAPQPVMLSLSRNGQSLSIKASAEAGFDAPLVVQMARFIPEQTVSIDHGENAGNTFSYTNIVTSLDEVGRWSPGAPLSMTVEIEGDAPVAIILQRQDHGKVEAAALLR